MSSAKAKQDPAGKAERMASSDGKVWLAPHPPAPIRSLELARVNLVCLLQRSQSTPECDRIVIIQRDIWFLVRTGLHIHRGTHRQGRSKSRLGALLIWHLSAGVLLLRRHPPHGFGHGACAPEPGCEQPRQDRPECSRFGEFELASWTSTRLWEEARGSC
jgi:hypothetical protein